MIIQHNMLAENTSRQIGKVTRTNVSSMEKLSTGYRINRAADDAAGLSISEKMRGQIKGLNQGADNVKDGIGLINTTDGAMAEQTDMLQRLREITLESYNDTYTQDDRLQIQYEAEAILAEIDRIHEDTEFNTIKVLQGNPIHKVTTYGPEMKTDFIPVTSKALPSWVISPDKLALPTEDISQSQARTENEIAAFNYFKGLDDNSNSRTYGDYNACATEYPGGVWQGTWSETLNDNYSAEVDFSNMAKVQTQTELLQCLEDLAGSCVGYECMTCTSQQGVLFVSDEVNFNNLKPADWRSHIDLQPYIDMVKELTPLTEEEFSEEKTAGNIPSAYTYTQYMEEHKTEVKNTAEEITAKIIDEINSSGAFNTYKHNIRITKLDDYKVLLYDFRDESSLSGADYGGKFRTFTVYQPTLVPVENTNWESSGIWIQAGANSDQKVILDLPDTGIGALGLEDYNVFPNGAVIGDDHGMDIETIIKDGIYIGNNTYEFREDPETKTIHHDEEDEPVGHYVPGTGANGEPTYIWVSDGTIHHDAYDEEVTVYNNVYQITIYPPDSITRVDEALRRLTRERVRMGAISNRLEYARSNNGISSENLQTAESRIRDTDYGNEMVSYAVNEILMQAGQAMLVQANNVTEGVLQLLR